MQFESSEQLSKHIEKFCSKSNYGRDEGLDSLYEQKLRERNALEKNNLHFKPSVYGDLKNQIMEDEVFK